MLSTDTNSRLRGFPTKQFLNERLIPFGIKFRIWISNTFTWFGLIFFLFGIPFTIVFNALAFFYAPSFNSGDPVSSGVITELLPTDASVNDIPVYQYNFSFEGADGKTYFGSGYATGNSKSIGEAVDVTYKADNPLVVEASGLRIEKFDSVFSLLILIFPGIGLFFMLIGTKKALNQIQILKVGKLAEGKFIGQEPTNMKINNRTVYALTFEFTADDQKTYQTIAKTHLTYKLTDEETEKLVYTPGNPEKAVLLDTLPKRIKAYFLREIRR